MGAVPAQGQQLEGDMDDQMTGEDACCSSGARKMATTMQRSIHGLTQKRMSCRPVAYFWFAI
jgi:hypothetical protein